MGWLGSIFAHPYVKEIKYFYMKLIFIFKEHKFKMTKIINTKIYFYYELIVSTKRTYTSAIMESNPKVIKLRSVAKKMQVHVKSRDGNDRCNHLEQ